MPITHPQHEPDFCLIFHDKSFPISKCLFGLYSPVFKKNLISKESFEINDPFIKADSFSQFVNACQEKFYNITVDNCFELLYLCIKWQNTIIKQEILSFISTINDSLSIIKQLEFILKTAESTGKKVPDFSFEDNEALNDTESYFQSADILIDIISKNINSYLVIQQFSTLPIPILEKILHKAISFHNINRKTTNSSHRPSNIDESSESENESSISFEHVPLKDISKDKTNNIINHHLLFDFLLSVFDKYGPESKPIFDTIDEFGGFTEKELNSLILLINPCYESPLNKLLDITSKQISQIENMQDQLKLLKAGSSKKADKIEQRVSTIRASIEAFIKKDESKNSLLSRDSSTASNLSLNSYKPRFSDYGSIVSQCNDEIKALNQLMNYDSSYKNVESNMNQIEALIASLGNKHPDLMQAIKPQTQKEEFPSLPRETISFDQFPHTNTMPRQSMILPTPYKSPKYSQSRKSSLLRKKEQPRSNSLYQQNDKGKRKAKNDGYVNIEAAFANSNEITCNFEQSEENDEIKQFDGIFTFLRNAFPDCGNLHDENIVDIQASSSNTVYQPKLLCDEKPGWFWSSKEEPNQWVKFDFKNCRVCANFYSIQTISNSMSTKHLKNWVLEGTNADGFTPNQVQDNNPAIVWTELDRRENNYQLNKINSIAVFDVQNNDQFYRYIRLRMIGPNHYGNNTLTLRKFELFGTLKLMSNNQ